MVVENPRWGAPRIHGELLMLGFDVSERSISRWMQRAPRDPEPAKRWLAFLRNHREVIAAMDFFTVPTLTFSVLHCFFVIDHGRRRILHFNVTRHPTSSWIVQQLREAFPYQSAPRLLIFDRDAKYGLEVPIAVGLWRSDPCGPRSEALGRTESPNDGWRAVGVTCWTTSSPSMSAICGVVVSSPCCTLAYHEDRTHLGLDKQTPAGRVQSMFRGPVVSRPRLGGLHHRYDRAA